MWAGPRRGTTEGMNAPAERRPATGGAPDTVDIGRIDEPGPARARRFGTRAVLAGSATVLAAVPLTVLTALVLSGSETLQSFDRGIADDLHGYVVDRPELASALGVVSEVTHPTVMRVVSVVIGVWLWRVGRRRQAGWFLTAMVVGSVLSPLLKEVIGRSRPSFPDPVALAPGYSFPSGHALQSMLFAASVVVLTSSIAHGRPGLRAAALAGAVGLVLLTGFDRVALGVHYTSDVVAGWVVALATLLTTLAIFHAPASAGPERN